MSTRTHIGDALAETCAGRRERLEESLVLESWKKGMTNKANTMNVGVQDVQERNRKILFNSPPGWQNKECKICNSNEKKQRGRNS